jgi:hypothetical protein
MDRIEVVEGLAAELYASEAAVDAAIVRTTALVQSLIEARANLSMSAVVASGSQTKMMETLAALGQAREAIVAAHAEMQKDHRKMGWGTFAAGPMNKPPEDGRPIEPTVRPALRVA